jgi:ABC-2 type transport system permease protein
MTALLNSARTEWLRLRKWPALWIMLGGWMFLNLLFSYAFPYLSYTSGSTSFANEGEARGQLLADVLPMGVPAAVVQGMPMFGGAIMLILGALSAGGGFGWGTWKTVFTQGPRRTTAFGGTLLTVLAVVVGVVVSTFLVDLGVSIAIALREGRDIVLPAAGDLLEMFAVGVAIFGMWAWAGVLIGVLTRSPALGVGLGLVWVLAVENLLRGVGTLLSPVATLTKVLPGGGPGSLAGLIATPISDGPEGTPGVLDIIGAGPAAVVTTAYIVGSVLVAAWLISRRDLT